MNWLIYVSAASFCVGGVLHIVGHYTTVRNLKRQLEAAQQFPNVVYVITCDYWNGGSGDLSVIGVTLDEDEAREYCNIMMKGQTSTYASSYDYEMFFLDQLEMKKG